MPIIDFVAGRDDDPQGALLVNVNDLPCRTDNPVASQTRSAAMERW